MYEAQLAQLTQQTFNIESTALATENLRNTMVTLDAMTQANKELRKQYGKIDIGKIEVCPFIRRTGHAVVLRPSRVNRRF
jgi:charged multivesicular body protein 5